MKLKITIYFIVRDAFIVRETLIGILSGGETDCGKTGEKLHFNAFFDNTITLLSYFPKD